MPRTESTQHHIFASALNAIGELCEAGLEGISSLSVVGGITTHSQIGDVGVSHKSGTFFQYFLPLRKNMVVLLAETYRRYFKLALAHASLIGRDPHRWALTQLQPAVRFALQWMRECYILACDGENQTVRREATREFVPGQTVSVPIPIAAPASPPWTSWRAPTWLFGISLPLFGIGLMKQEHVPNVDSTERLGEAHTRLLLKGAKRVLLWDLEAAIETVRREETAAAGAIRVEAANGQRRGPNKRKGWEQKAKLYGVIRTVLSAKPTPQGIKFCAELDKRHAPPLFDWINSGEWRDGLTWKEAWNIFNLRRKIRRVRQEAQKTS
jgi:hypothetical protein